MCDMRPHLQARVVQHNASWTMDVHDAMRLVYAGTQLKQWHRADGGVARRKLPDAKKNHSELVGTLLPSHR